jgi:Piezo non-specific cation channel, R-Ras-binding domain
LYIFASIVQILMLVVIFLFFKQMEEPSYGGAAALKNITGERFSGRMTIFLFFQIGFIVFERYLFLMNPKEWTDWETFKKSKSDYGDPRHLIIKRICRNLENTTPRNKMISIFRRVHFLTSLFNMKADDFFKLVQQAHSESEQANSIEYKKTQDYVHNPLYKRLTYIKVLMGFFYLAMFVYFPLMGHYKVSGGPFCNSYFHPIERQKCNHVNENIYIQLFFFLTTLYFILCALQIKYGESFLKNQKKKDSRWTMSEKITNLIVTKAPFIFEIKTALDFAVTKTSLGLFEWFKFEDIYNTFFAAKYAQISSDMKKLGLVRSTFEKVLFGWVALFVFLGIVLAPIFIFSNFNPDSVANTILSIESSVGIKIEYSKFELYRNTNPKELKTLDESDFYKYIGTNTSTKLTYQQDQMQIINLYPFGDTTWAITPDMYTQLDNLLLGTLKDQSTAHIYLNFKTTQLSGKALTYYDERALTPEMVLSIHQMMVKCTDSKVIIPKFYDRLTQITQEGFKPFNESDTFNKTVELTPVCKNDTQNSTKPDKVQVKYWNVTTSDVGASKWEKEGNKGIAIFVVLDNFSRNLSMFTSVVAMYTGFVLIIGNIIRGLFTGQTTKLWTTDVPKAEQIIRICEGVTAARIEGNTFREEVLYWELVDIMRSPEMIKLITANYLDHKKKIEKVHAKNEASS